MKLEALRQPWTLRVCSYKQITFTEDVFFSVQCQLDGRSDFPWRKSGAQPPHPPFFFLVGPDVSEAGIHSSLLGPRQPYPYFLVYLSDLSGGGWHLMI